jgi:hypothetical protein
VSEQVEVHGREASCLGASILTKTLMAEKDEVLSPKSDMKVTRRAIEGMFFFNGFAIPTKMG